MQAFLSFVGRATASPLPDKSECQAQTDAPDLLGSQAYFNRGDLLPPQLRQHICLMLMN